MGRPPFETPDVKSTYKKIKMCAYTFPEHIPLSEDVKNIITRVLVKNPSKRLSLDEVLAHPFLNSTGIPKFLPLSTLACPPSKNYLNQIRNSDVSNKNTKNPKIEKKSKKFLILDENGDSTENYNNQDNNQANKTNNRESNNSANNDNDSQEIYVTKWVDYSSKYGLGYLLSNKNSGVFFNDCTKVILNPATKYIKCFKHF